LTLLRVAPTACPLKAGLNEPCSVIITGEQRHMIAMPELFL